MCGWYSNGVPPFFQKDLSNAQFRIQNRSLLVKRKWHLQKPFIRLFTFCRFYNEIIRKQKKCALYSFVAWNCQILKIVLFCCIFTTSSICRTLELERKCVNRKYFWLKNYLIQEKTINFPLCSIPKKYFLLSSHHHVIVKMGKS